MRQPAYKRHDFYPGSFTEREKLCTDARGALLRKVSRGSLAGASKGKGTSGGPTRPKTDAVPSGRSTRSSVEAPVMGEERRGRIIQV